MSSLSEWRPRNPHYCLGRFNKECEKCISKLTCDIHMGIEKFYNPYNYRYEPHPDCAPNLNWAKDKK